MSERWSPSTRSPGGCQQKGKGVILTVGLLSPQWLAIVSKAPTDKSLPLIAGQSGGAFRALSEALGGAGLVHDPDVGQLPLPPDL